MVMTLYTILWMTLQTLTLTHFDGDDPVDLLGDDPGESRFEGLEAGEEAPRSNGSNGEMLSAVGRRSSNGSNEIRRAGG